MSPRRKADGAKTPMVREAAVAYEPHSVAKVFWIAFQSLSQEEQGAFLRKLLDDPEWYEEVADAVAMIESQDEPARAFEEFEEELRREKLL
jgi:hypothetical protein